MHNFLFLFLFFVFSLQGHIMQEFLVPHVPLRQDGKIDIPPNIKHVKLDIGLSYSAPMSQYWLLHEDDLIVFGFEPDVNSVSSIKRGAIKQDPSHGEPLDPKYVGKSFFVVPCALGLLSGTAAPFYITKNSCGCSSLYEPKDAEVARVIEVPVFRLSDFFELLPFDTHPVIDYIKIDAQGSDLDIVKSGGSYLQERVVYITVEAEDDQYKGTTNSVDDIDRYMKSIGFIKEVSHNTADPTYFNPRFREYIRENTIQIYQRG